MLPTRRENPYPRSRSRAGLEGGEWVNVAKPLSLADLRGRFVLLDFWTYCCINCMHVLPELKKLEHAFPNELVVVGVHSAKFEGEQGRITFARRCCGMRSSIRWSTTRKWRFGAGTAREAGRRWC